MTQQPNLTAENFQEGPEPGRSFTAARLISQVFHPVILGVVNVLLVGLLAMPQERLTGLAWAAFCVLLQIMPGTIFFAIRMRQGAYSDNDVSKRQERNELYCFSTIALFMGIIILLLIKAPKPFLAINLSAAVLNVLSWGINVFWKISVHSAGIASCAATALLYSLEIGLGLWICALAVGWARIRTSNHTPMQVLAGMSLATVCVFGSFMIFGLFRR
jgi:membrane-associated phospholipid phosphatase